MLVNLRTRKVCRRLLHKTHFSLHTLVEILKFPALTQEKTHPTLLVADATLAAYPTQPSNVEVTPPEAAIIADVTIDEKQESNVQGTPNVDITPSSIDSKPPVVIAKIPEPSPSAEPIIELDRVVESVTPRIDTVVDRADVESVAPSICEDAVEAEQARHQAELTGTETVRQAEEKGVAKELAAKAEADRAAREAGEKARIEHEAHEAGIGQERQAQLKLEEREAKPVKADEAEGLRLEASGPQRQAELVKKQALEEEEAQKLREVEIAKLESEAARLEAEYKEREQARLLEKEIEEASDCPVAPSSPRSALSFITSGFDSPSQVSLASHVPAAPSSPRIEPDDPTPVAELPESNLFLQNRSPKSINSSIAGEPPETPFGSLPNSSLLAVGEIVLACLNAC
jgi:hypothetical protein